MSVADRSIDPRIIESAKEEFLQKGFLDASLQEICKNAGVTTGALYKRFKGKEELFCALVESTVQDLEEVVRQKSVLPQRSRTNSSKRRGTWTENICSGGLTISMTATMKCACCSYFQTGRSTQTSSTNGWRA